jgi:predicted esterase
VAGAVTGPHAGSRVVAAGAPLDRAAAAMILVHGRGASAESMIPLGEAFGRTDIAFLAPQAAGSTWYPYSFVAPIEQNEPWLSSALSLLGALVGRLEEEGFPPERVVLAGFSQGACLATEFAARNARRYGAVAGLSGGLIGPPGTPRDHAGSLDGTPVFLGCSDIDPHIPLKCVQETTSVLSAMGAEVDERIYPGFGHSVHADEVEAVKRILARVAGAEQAP